MQFFDRHFPAFFCALIMFPLPVALLIGACSGEATPDEKAALDKGYADNVKEEIVTLSPRPGVECYVLRGHGSVTPRVMSCVALPSGSK